MRKINETRNQVTEMDSYFILAGQIINQAVIDYRFHGRGSEAQYRESAYLDAKDFLFTDRLENFLNTFAINGVTTVRRVRERAREQIQPWEKMPEVRVF